MKKVRKIQRIYREDQNIDIHIDIHASGHMYEMDLIGLGRKIRQKVDMLPDDLSQINNRIREAFIEVACSKVIEKGSG
jgi:hypothetical protein